MAGVSPLSETDLKRNNNNIPQRSRSRSQTSSFSTSNNNKVQQQEQQVQEQQQQQQDWLLERQAQREQVAPPPDALQKPSVSIFFALLGIIPSLLLLYAVSFGGIKPFGL
jgi:hypothetical protein